MNITSPGTISWPLAWWRESLASLPSCVPVKWPPAGKSTSCLWSSTSHRYAPLSLRNIHQQVIKAISGGIHNLTEIHFYWLSEIYNTIYWLYLHSVSALLPLRLVQYLYFTITSVMNGKPLHTGIVHTAVFFFFFVVWITDKLLLMC